MLQTERSLCGRRKGAFPTTVWFLGVFGMVREPDLGFWSVGVYALLGWPGTSQRHCAPRNGTVTPMMIPALPPDRAVDEPKREEVRAGGSDRRQCAPGGVYAASLTT